MTFKRFASTVKRNIADIAVAYLLVVLTTTGFQVMEIAKLLLAIKLNVLALPLYGVVFDFTWWVWYILALVWLAQILYFTGYSIPEAIKELENDYITFRQKDENSFPDAEDVPEKTRGGYGAAEFDD